MTVSNPFNAPVVDSLGVRVRVDSRYERFLPRLSHPLVQVEHVRRILGRPDMTLAAEWGLSLHLASMRNGAKAQYVLDFGYTPEIINRNFDLLDIDHIEVLRGPQGTLFGRNSLAGAVNIVSKQPSFESASAYEIGRAHV